MKPDELFSLLKEQLVYVGLSPEQAEEYVWFVRRWYRPDLKLELIKAEQFLPSDSCLRTLSEAQRIVNESAVNKVNPRELHVTEIRRFLSIPDTQWKTAKKTIGNFFGQKESAVNAVYNSDEGWLVKTADECLDAAIYTNYICQGNNQLAWKVFQHTGLLGREETEKRAESLFELLGHDDGVKLIEIDAYQDNWLFYHSRCINPARCIAYLKQCGLSNKQIGEFVIRYGYVLYLFSMPNMQAKVDSIIDRFGYEWMRDFGPCYDGLSLEKIEFLIHGPGKLQG